jgi:AAA ATPase domain
LRAEPRTSAGELRERDGELAALDELAAAAADGRGRLVLIEGPAGIGKSGLLGGLRDRSAPGLRVLAARAGELEREFAYGVVRQLFEAPVADARATALAGAAAPAAAVFEAAPAADAEGSASFAALHGLYWLTLNLTAERPLLLAIDDLHWCDRPSCGSSPTSPGGSTASPRSSRPRCAPASSRPTRRCWASWPAIRRRWRSGPGR